MHIRCIKKELNYVTHGVYLELYVIITCAQYFTLTIKLEVKCIRIELILYEIIFFS